MCKRQGFGQTVQKTVIPQLVVDVLAVAVHRQGVDVPAIMQRRSLAVGGATDSVHCLIWWTSHSAQRQVSQLGAMKDFFDAFCVIFRAPPVVPELSASFSSFRLLTTVLEGSTGAGVAGSLLSGDSAPGLPINAPM